MDAELTASRLNRIRGYQSDSYIMVHCIRIITLFLSGLNIPAKDYNNKTASLTSNLI